MSSSYRATSGRHERSSYATTYRHKKTGAKPTVRKQPPITQEERIAWALTRVRSMRSRVAAHPDDSTLRAALAARQAEYERERVALQRITLRGRR